MGAWGGRESGHERGQAQGRGLLCAGTTHEDVRPCRARKLAGGEARLHHSP